QVSRPADISLAPCRLAGGGRAAPAGPPREGGGRLGTAGVDPGAGRVQDGGVAGRAAPGVDGASAALGPGRPRPERPRGYRLAAAARQGGPTATQAQLGAGEEAGADR